MSLQDLIKNWQEELVVQRRYSENTVIAYQRDLLNFKNFLQEHLGSIISLKELQNLKTVDFRAWLSRRISSDFTARSNVRALSSIKSFFNYLAKHNLMGLTVINSVKRPKLAKLLPKPIQQNLISSFLEATFFFENDPEWITDRDRALFTLLYCTGLRINEALNIKTRDIGPEIKIRGKGKKDRVIILLPLVLERIEKYISTCPYDLNEGILFVGLRGKKIHASFIDSRLKKLRFMYNLPDHASAHAFRHSFASHLIQKGADLRSVQELLGHESLTSTQIYTDIDDSNLLKVYGNTHPLEKDTK